MNALTLHVLLVVFAATLIRSAFGFGEALFAVPLLALRLPLAIAAPLAVLISITIAAIVVAQDWQKIHLRSTLSLVFATLFGIPMGLWLLTSSHQRAAKVALAALIMGGLLFFLSPYADPWLTKSLIVRFLALAVLVGGGIAVYGLACFATGAFALDDLKTLLRRRARLAETKD